MGLNDSPELRAESCLDASAACSHILAPLLNEVDGSRSY